MFTNTIPPPGILSLHIHGRKFDVSQCTDCNKYLRTNYVCMPSIKPQSFAITSFSRRLNHWQTVMKWVLGNVCHCSHTGLQKICKDVVWISIGGPFNNAPDIIVFRINIRRARVPHPNSDVVVKLC